MAKKKKSKRSNPYYHNPVRRLSIGRGRLILTASPLPRSFYQNLDDRYFFPSHTTLPRHPRTRYGAQASLSTHVKKGTLHAYLKARYPRSTLICVRRKTRKEVMFARGLAGRRLGTKSRRTNATSTIRC